MVSPQAFALPELSGIARITAGYRHTCVLTTAGGVKCWGYNSSGQLGDDSGLPRSTVVDVAGLGSGVASVSAGYDHTCAVTAAGGAKCWGSNASGSLGDGTALPRAAPVNVSGLGTGVSVIAGGGSHTCALTTAGGVKCWGNNYSGQLGDFSKTDRLTPVDVFGLSSGATAIAASWGHTCAVAAGGGLKCWGGNNYGQLGDGFTYGRTEPADVVGLPGGVAAVAASAGFTCALTSAGGVKCWGSNALGQLGDNTTTDHITPQDVPTLTSGVAAIGTGSGHTCALTAAGGVKCWGYNAAGQLGDGSTANRLVPVDVVGLASGVQAIAVGDAHTCALTITGTVKCWGYNDQGQLGDDTPGFRAVPGPVVILLDLFPAAMYLGGQSMQTTTPARVVRLTNTTGAPLTVTSITASTYFAVTNDCTTLAPAETCSLNVTFTPTVQGWVAGTVTVATSARTQTVTLWGTGEKSLVTHYYRSILRRAPDESGKSFWESEAARMQSLGVNVNETWYAMAASFFFSPEYASFNRSGAEFVTDLYNTFFNRAPDGGGLGFWTGQLALGMPREVVLVSFMFSPEFRVFTQGIFGNTAVRAEIDTVVDFYRGLLSRLPDIAGFYYWLGQFHVAQCAGAGAVYQGVESISSQFATGGEYAARSRSNAQYVGDLYNAFLRRGGDLAGVQYWIDQLNAGTMTREFVRRQFIGSAEFTGRVNAIIAQGCLP